MQPTETRGHSASLRKLLYTAAHTASDGRMPSGRGQPEGTLKPRGQTESALAIRARAVTRSTPTPLILSPACPRMWQTLAAPSPSFPATEGSPYNRRRITHHPTPLQVFCSAPPGGARCWHTTMGWWQNVISRDGAADAFEMQCRKTILFASIPGLCSCLFIAISQTMHLGVCAWFLLTALAWATWVWGLCKRRFTQRFMIFYIVVTCAAITMADLYFYQTNLQVAWPAFVIVIDLILVLRLDHRIATAVVCYVVMWLLLSLVERVTRFGLYDVPLTDSYEIRLESYIQMVLGCATPPCKSSLQTAWAYQSVGLAVFVVDYITTRGFAQQVLKEQAAMQSTIATVETIASLLAAYDVDAVSRILGDDGTVLPDAMRAALLRLEQNLRAYRPYLPKSCLPCAQLEDEHANLMGALPGDDDVQEVSFISEINSNSNSSVGESVRSPQALAMKPATLLFVDMSGSGALLQDSLHAFEQAFADTLATTLQCVEQRAGIVDLFVGDRISCSFNTSRRCATHPSAALYAAKQALFGTVAVRATAAAVTGKACCGDIGCADMRRFSVVGTLPAHAHIMERAGAIVGLPLVCNKTCQQDSECTHEMRLVPLRVGFPLPVSKGTDLPTEVADEAHTLYEVLPSDNSNSNCSDRPTSPAEWMYELDCRSTAWYAYNSAVSAYLQGASMEDVLELSGDKHDALATSLRSVGSRDVLRIVV